MPFYTGLAEDVASSSSADTYTTILGLLAADTAGHRGRLRKLTVGMSEDTPGDTTYAVQVKRVDDVSAGSAGTATALTEGQIHSLSIAPNVAALHTYTVEPSTYGQPLWHGEFNSRASAIVEWGPDEAPVVDRDQLLGVLVAVRSAVAKNVSIHAEWEEF